ncbi:MAG: arginase [Candidatus Sericytochromatia bacterium]
MRKGQTISIIGAPLDLGAGHRGVDAGPSAFRIAGLVPALRAMGFPVVDEGNIHVEIPEALPEGQSNAKYLAEIAMACEAQRLKVLEALEKKHFPLVLGGDHSIAIGTIAGISSYYREMDQEIGVIWVDAHADMNTPDTTESGNIHGMPLSVALGLGAPELVQLGGFVPKIKSEHVVLIGIRDLDLEEKKLVKKMGVKTFTMTDIDELGMPTVIRQAIEIAGAGTAGIHLSFDFDGLDPEVAPGVGTPVKGGIRYREAHLLMEKIALTGRLIGLEMVELNPILDMRNKTAELGVELIESAFGKRIL